MSIDIDTKALLEHDLKNQLDILEKERIKKIHKRKFFQIYEYWYCDKYCSTLIKEFTILFLFYYLTSLVDGLKIIDIIYWILMFGIIYLAIILTLCALYSKHKATKENAGSKFINKVKRKVYPSFIKLLDTQLNYATSVDAKKSIQVDKILKNIFDYTSLNLEDHIWGKYNNADVDIVDFKIAYSNQKTFNNNGKTVLVDELCRGLFFNLKIKKNLTSKIIVSSNNFISKATMGRSKVQLETQEFNTRYDAICDDQVEARYFLTPTITERLINFDKNGKKLCLMAGGNDIFIVLSSAKDFFEFDMTKPITDFSQYANVLSEIKEVLDFIEVLKLNLDVGL